MEMKLELNKDYGFLKQWLLDLPQSFNYMGEVLIDGRNQVRLIEVDGCLYVVKYFKRVTLFNRYVYRYLRASKGERAYCNAQTLLQKGIDTPTPIAYLDVYEHARLKYSFFISLYEKGQSAYQLMNQPLQQIDNQLNELASFLYLIHRKGVFHADLNLTNVLCHIEDETTKFCLIDNNRIRFKSYSRRRAMRNLRRVRMPLVNYAALVSYYARIANQEPFNTLGIMMFYRRVNTQLRLLRKFVKRKVLFQSKENSHHPQVSTVSSPDSVPDLSA